MVRKKQPAPSPFKMYRHFAAVTLVFTAAIAILSDGQTREAMADDMSAREQRLHLEKASEAKFGKPKLVKKGAQQTGGQFGRDTGGFGDPMEDPGTTGSGYMPDPGAPGNYAPAAYNHYGLTGAQWAALSEEQREALRNRAVREAALAKSNERRSQVDALMEASAGRAGAAISDD